MPIEQVMLQSRPSISLGCAIDSSTLAGQRLGLHVGVFAVQQHQEFVAAESRHAMRRTHGAQSSGNALQQRIAGPVAEVVVDVLEAVQRNVQQHHRCPV